MDLLSYDFVQRALIAAVLTGLAAPAIGTYLVQRRQSLMGDGIGHVAVTGVALGLLTGTSPVLAAVCVCIIAAVVIEIVRERGGASGDVALALLFYGGIAGGVFLTGLAGQSAATLNKYLFGSITTIDTTELVITAGLAVVLLLVAVGGSGRLFAISQDPEFARVSGLDVRVYNIAISVLAALTVTVAMRTVGLLLVSALMVVPVATAQQVTRSFRGTLLASMAWGTAAAFSGLMVSANLDVAPGATIVLLSLIGFSVAWPVGVWARRRRRTALPSDSLIDSEHAGHHGGHDEPFADPAGEDHHCDHDHRHGPACGHPAVQHRDHVDYLHDGHRHAPHGSHYDEH